MAHDRQILDQPGRQGDSNVVRKQSWTSIAATYTVALPLVTVFLMVKEPSYAVLLRYFDKTASLKGLAAGVVIGIPSWIWGESPVPAVALKFVSGFGWLLIALVFAAIILSFMAFYLEERVGRLAHGDFQNALRWGHPKLLRAIAVLFGLVVIAAVCWGVTGSINALKTALLGALLGSTLFWCWGGLAAIADELSKRFASASL